jgi:hypothetical protein
MTRVPSHTGWERPSRVNSVRRTSGITRHAVGVIACEVTAALGVFRRLARRPHDGPEGENDSGWRNMSPAAMEDLSPFAYARQGDPRRAGPLYRKAVAAYDRLLAGFGTDSANRVRSQKGQAGLLDQFRGCLGQLGKDDESGRLEAGLDAARPSPSGTAVRRRLAELGRWGWWLALVDLAIAVLILITMFLRENRQTTGHFDKLGVIGSSPIAPTHAKTKKTRGCGYQTQPLFRWLWPFGPYLVPVRAVGGELGKPFISVAPFRPTGCVAWHDPVLVHHRHFMRVEGRLAGAAIPLLAARCPPETRAFSGGQAAPWREEWRAIEWPLSRPR